MSGAEFANFFTNIIAKIIEFFNAILKKLGIQSYDDPMSVELKG